MCLYCKRREVRDASELRCADRTSAADVERILVSLARP
jgi:hypothetical protein